MSNKFTSKCIILNVLDLGHHEGELKKMSKCVDGVGKIGSKTGE